MIRCSSNGTTAFELAVARAEPDLELIQLMLDRGCDPTAIFQLAMHDLHVYQLIHCHLLNKASIKTIVGFEYKFKYIKYTQMAVAMVGVQFDISHCSYNPDIVFIIDFV